MSTFGFVGDLLVKKGVVDAAAMARAAAAQSKQPSSLGRTLAGLGLADEAAVAKEVAAALHLEYLDASVVVEEPVVSLLPADFCRKRGVLPLGFAGSTLRVAVTDPLDYSALQDVEFRCGKKAVAVVVTQSWLDAMMGQPDAVAPATPYDMFGEMKPTGEVEAAATTEYELVDPATLTKETQLPPIVRLVNLILSDAAKSGASDVHIEPQEQSLQVRQRVDGLLREVITIPQHLKDQTISRLKIISGMDIAERRKPQDGRSRLRFEGRRIDLRVSTLPTQFGEKVVIRLLNSDKAILPMDKLGLAPDNLSLLKSFLSQPQGMILVTGPTGSGKTSTLYASLNSIKSPTNNIISLEDPIEFQLPGINQTQINTRAGVTFASGLRSILRQDPNVILVGEIRDQETADIALQAAQTGHLLLSTLHTNDSPATITRLFDLGIPPFLVASSIIGIVAQRLVRRVCPSCAEPQKPSPEVVEKAGGWSRLPADGHWVVGRGCDACGGSGLKGRLAIHEILQVNDEVRDLISTRGAETAIRKAAKRNGMRTLLEDGISKAAQGLTTLEDVLRVVASVELHDTVEDLAPAAAPVAAALATAPIAAPTPAAQPAPAAPRAVAPPAPVADAATHTTKRRVLVVEDSPTIMSVIKYFLELEGFEVLAAGDGQVGLDLALRERPDVIVSDVQMPLMTGVEMVTALRADAAMAGVRILMLTSEDSVEAETRGLEAGADDYILKPVEPRRLAARVKALLGRPRAA
jgi:type IV pilus assembly protein PilB